MEGQTPQTLVHEMSQLRTELNNLFCSKPAWFSKLKCPLSIERKENESEVTQLCPTCWDPIGCSPPGSSVQGIFQARVLEWVAISFSKGSS